MPNSSRTSRFRPGALPAAVATVFPAFLAAAASLLQGCLRSGVYESPYTVPAGETFQDVQLEIEPDGTVLLLAQTAMYFGHEDPQGSWDSVPQRRNHQTHLYRRTTGGWNATSFRNLQREFNAFPVLLPDESGRFQALVWDYRWVVRHAFREGKWKAGMALDPPSGELLASSFYGRNWSRHSRIGLEGDSTAHFISTTYGAATEALTRPGGGRTFLDTSHFTPFAFHVGKEIRAAVGIEHPFYRENRTPGFQARLVYYSWRPGADSAGKSILGEGDLYFDCAFSPFKGSMGLFISGPGIFRVLRIGPGGSLVEEGSGSGPDADKPSSFLFAADTSGCIHFLKHSTGQGGMADGMIHSNTCTGEVEDTLAFPTPRPEGNHRLRSVRLRLHPSGIPVVALSMSEDKASLSLAHGDLYERSWLYLAERKDGRWNLELVAEK